MSHRHYIDGEPPGFAELDAVIEAGGSTIEQSADAAWPERGSIGFRSTTDGSAAAYMTKNLGGSVAAGGDLYIGFWQRVNSEGGFRHNPIELRNTADDTWVGLLYNQNSRDLLFYARDDDWSSELVTLNNLITTGRWHYIVLRVHRASSAVAADGYTSLYLDGELRGTTATVDNFDMMLAPTALNVGARFYYRDGWEVDFDEIKVATTYPEPYVPTPSSELLSAERTCVLYRRALADSQTFADYCVSQLGVPRANLIPLPDATANETLADYATFQSEVEDGIDDYLALNPTVATNCMAFIVGYGVPGYFTDSGLKHSATSRLAKYGVAFSSGASNQLYVPGATIARLTLTTLRFVGQHLATRIDAPSLAEAKTLIDRAATVSALDALADDDTLYADDAAYLASLPCQKLRIITAALALLDAAALVWDDNGADFGTGGSRAIFHNDQADSAELLRSGTARCKLALFTSTFAAAFGSADTAETFDATRFFEMLRIGGTFAEAAMVAASKLNYTAVAAGSPLMTVAVQLGGYNIYRGVGSPAAIDYDTPVAHLRAGVAAADLVSLGHVAGQVYYYAIRAVSDRGVEETNIDDPTEAVAIVRVEVDGDGNLLAGRPNPVVWCMAEAVAAGQIRVTFRYYGRGQLVAPANVQIARITGGVADWASPLATVPVTGSGVYKVTLGPTFAHHETLRMALRAVSAAGVASAETRCPAVAADAEGPLAVTAAVAEQVSE